MHLPFSSSKRTYLGRRAFLFGTMVGGVALASGIGCSRTTPAQNAAVRGASGAKKLGVALVGLGSYSTEQLAPALRRTQHCALAGIVTGTPSKVATWQSQYDIPDRSVYDYQTLRRMADDPAIDVVYVVVPTALHAKYAIMAAEAGKHVWCEKPMAMTVAECQTIIDACKKNRVSLSIGYRMHHEPNTQTVMAYARDKPYGAIASVRAVAGNRDDGDSGWRMERAMGGGALYDLGVYSINAIRYASGEEPTHVTRARQWAERPELFREVDENTEFELSLPSGAVAYGKASRSNRENIVRVEAARGWYELSPMQAYSGVKGQTSDGTKLERPVDNQQARQMDEESLAIIERRAPIVPGEEGQRDIHIVQAIIESAESGRSVSL